MNYFHAVILGIVEGLTEFLPISSTAHLEIVSKLLKIAESPFVKTFEIAIQLGAILAVVVLYFSILKRNWKIWGRIIAAFIPTAIIGLTLYKIVKEQLLGNDALLIWTIGIGGVVLIICEFLFRDHRYVDAPGRTEQELGSLSYPKAFLIGLAQAIALVPGVSRSAATIVAGRALGVSRKAIVEFSFLLAVPTMAAAVGYELLKSASILTAQNSGIIAVGFISAFLCALVAVKFFLKFIQERTLITFGVYRIILALVLVYYFLHK
jgi:undecaprenyl-diphosphatase